MCCKRTVQRADFKAPRHSTKRFMAKHRPHPRAPSVPRPAFSALGRGAAVTQRRRGKSALPSQLHGPQPALHGRGATASALAAPARLFDLPPTPLAGAQLPVRSRSEERDCIRTLLGAFTSLASSWARRAYSRQCRCCAAAHLFLYDYIYLLRLSATTPNREGNRAVLATLRPRGRICSQQQQFAPKRTADRPTHRAFLQGSRQ